MNFVNKAALCYIFLLPLGYSVPPGYSDDPVEAVFADMERAAAVIVVGEVILVFDKGLRTLEGRGIAGGGRLSKSILG